MLKEHEQSDLFCIFVSSFSIVVRAFRVFRGPVLRYHGIGCPSRKNPPVGPPSGKVAAQTMPAAP